MLKPEIDITFEPLNPSIIQAIDIKLSFEEKESGGLATFQALGRLHREMDVVHDHNPSYIASALNYYHALFCDELEWPQAMPLHILFMGPSWKSRMCLAWFLLSEDEQTAARGIDYKKFHNYWPNLDFLKPNWEKQVERDESVRQLNHALSSASKLH